MCNRRDRARLTMILLLRFYFPVCREKQLIILAEVFYSFE